MEENLKIPNHVAIILDGNGRWAKAKGMPRNYGHMQGAKTVEVICEEAYRMGIQYLTVYAFSTENWNRPQDEVDALMKLLRNYMKTCLKTAAKNDMKIRVIGDIEPSSDKLPVLLKKYISLNAKIIGFNIDPKFNMCLDGLLILDIFDVPMKTIESLSKEINDDTILSRFSSDSVEL